MAGLKLTAELLDLLVVGGSFYGGGGGGSPDSGLEMGRVALGMGEPHLVDLDDVPGDALLVTVSAVGAPAGCGVHACAADYVKAVELLQHHTGKRVSGFIANECGGLATVNGWVQSAATGLPVVDAPCNGRAHPTGAMGSMGLHLVSGFVSEQVAVGGSREDGTYLEFFARGSVEVASGLVRKAAAQTGGLLAVARNPVTAAYAREHAAPGAIRRCLAVGRAILAGEAGTVDRREFATAAVEAAACASGGHVVSRGTVVQKDLETTGGFDVGRVVVESHGPLELTFCNEYLTLEALSLSPGGFVDPGHSVRLATFPDLIVTLDLLTGLPVSSAEVRTEQAIAVVVVPQRNLILGAGVRDRKLYADVERLVGKEIARYAFG